jgi:hypothetical protein
MGAKSIVRLKITLDRVEPVVMRRVTVRAAARARPTTGQQEAMPSRGDACQPSR